MLAGPRLARPEAKLVSAFFNAFGQNAFAARPCAANPM
jgi:hypothetical protein